MIWLHVWPVGRSGDLSSIFIYSLCIYLQFDVVYLCFQELVKHTTDPTDKDNLRTALDAMRVSVYVCVLFQLLI